MSLYTIYIIFETVQIYILINTGAFLKWSIFVMQYYRIITSLKIKFFCKWSVAWNAIIVIILFPLLTRKNLNILYIITYILTFYIPNSYLLARVKTVNLILDNCRPQSGVFYVKLEWQSNCRTRHKVYNGEGSNQF